MSELEKKITTLAENTKLSIWQGKFKKQFDELMKMTDLKKLENTLTEAQKIATVLAGYHKIGLYQTAFENKYYQAKANALFPAFEPLPADVHALRSCLNSISILSHQSGSSNAFKLEIPCLILYHLPKTDKSQASTMLRDEMLTYLKSHVGAHCLLLTHVWPKCSSYSLDFYMMRIHLLLTVLDMYPEPLKTYKLVLMKQLNEFLESEQTLHYISYISRLRSLLESNLPYYCLQMDKLAQQDAQLAKLVELRYFTGLTVDETAQILGISVRTAKRNWAYARAWLQREMNR